MNNGNRPGSGGRGRNRGGGRMEGNRPASGPGGQCMCPQCGNKIDHVRGKPCYSQNCPKCGAAMIKE